MKYPKANKHKTDQALLPFFSIIFIHSSNSAHICMQASPCMFLQPTFSNVSCLSLFLLVALPTQPQAKLECIDALPQIPTRLVAPYPIANSLNKPPAAQSHVIMCASPLILEFKSISCTSSKCSPCRRLIVCHPKVHHVPRCRFDGATLCAVSCRGTSLVCHAPRMVPHRYSSR